MFKIQLSISSQYYFLSKIENELFVFIHFYIGVFMQFKIFLICIGVYLINFAYTNKAYCYDCAIYCDSVLWSSDSISQFTYDNCTYTVVWTYRHALCEGINYCQFRVNRIYPTPNIPACRIDIAGSYSLVMAAAEHILFENGYDTPCASGLEPDSCKVNLAVSWSACFQYENSGPSGPTDLVPCTEKVICCHSTWKLCLDSRGNPMEPVQIAQIGINPICPSGECFGVCDEEEKK